MKYIPTHHRRERKVSGNCCSNYYLKNMKTQTTNKDQATNNQKVKVSRK